ncbi:hypothetical protein PEC301875_27150 [Pectobacterium carotovorum subsp. carotovorum]|nr:hypothetical protein PEC301875_27150 [Pectobacterium carotovorum subsp. carotovorum]
MGFYAGTPNTRYQNITYCDGLFKKQAYRTIILYIQTAPFSTSGAWHPRQPSGNRFKIGAIKKPPKRFFIFSGVLTKRCA